MKKLILPFFLLVALSITSCKKEKDKCEGVTCINGGTCVDGVCSCVNNFTGDSCQVHPVCATGYEGDLCNIQSRGKFLGDFVPTWLCMDSQAMYTVERVNISPEADITQIRISRIYNRIGAICNIQGQYLTIDHSLSPDTAISGYGYCEGYNKSIQISFQVTVAGTLVDSCRIVFTHP
jgi:hypothetical protein